MVDATSVLFSFTKVDNFFELLIDSEDITTAMFDGQNDNFMIVLAEQCNNNIQNNLNADGTLNTDEVTVLSGLDPDNGKCAMLWNVGVNSNRAITIASNVVHYELGDGTHMLKGAFLITAESGVVLAYSINNAPIPLGNSFTAPVDGMVWSIRNQIYEG